MRFADTSYQAVHRGGRQRGSRGDPARGHLGFKASNANDDNLIIVQGNGPLAAAYAINIIAIFDTYRWNSHDAASQPVATAVRTVSSHWRPRLP